MGEQGGGSVRGVRGKRESKQKLEGNEYMCETEREEGTYTYGYTTHS